MQGQVTKMSDEKKELEEEEDQLLTENEEYAASVKNLEAQIEEENGIKAQLEKDLEAKDQ